MAFPHDELQEQRILSRGKSCEDVTTGRIQNEKHCESLLQESFLAGHEEVDQEFHRYIELCARTFNVSTVAVRLADSQVQWINQGGNSKAVEHAQCDNQRTIALYMLCMQPESPAVTVVHNASVDERFEGVGNDDEGKFFVGASLALEGVKVGALCLIDREPVECFTLADQQSLMDIASIFSQIISSRRSKCLRKCQQISQQYLSLIHNLRTPCTTLQLSVHSLGELLSSSFSKQQVHSNESLTTEMKQLSSNTSHLTELVSHLTDLCKLMPASRLMDGLLQHDASMRVLATERKCALPKIIDVLRRIYCCMLSKREEEDNEQDKDISDLDMMISEFRVNSFLLSRICCYETFPETISSVALGMINALALIKTSATGSLIVRKEVTLDVESFPEVEDSQFLQVKGQLELDMPNLNEESKASLLLPLNSWAQTNVNLLKIAGGKSSVTVSSGDGKATVECSFSVPISISEDLKKINIESERTRSISVCSTCTKEEEESCILESPLSYRALIVSSSNSTRVAQGEQDVREFLTAKGFAVDDLSDMVESPKTYDLLLVDISLPYEECESILSCLQKTQSKGPELVGIARSKVDRECFLKLVTGKKLTFSSIITIKPFDRRKLADICEKIKEDKLTGSLSTQMNKSNSQKSKTKSFRKMKILNPFKNFNFFSKRLKSKILPVS